MNHPVIALILSHKVDTALVPYWTWFQALKLKPTGNIFDTLPILKMVSASGTSPGLFLSVTPNPFVHKVLPLYVTPMAHPGCVI